MTLSSSDFDDTGPAKSCGSWSLPPLTRAGLSSNSFAGGAPRQDMPSLRHGAGSGSGSNSGSGSGSGSGSAALATSDHDGLSACHDGVLGSNVVSGSARTIASSSSITTISGSGSGSKLGTSGSGGSADGAAGSGIA